MKNRHNKPARLTQSFLTLLTILLAVGLAPGPRAFAIPAVDANWVGGTSQDWNNTVNWSANPSGLNVFVNIASGNYPIVSGTPSWTPVDITIGQFAGNVGELDQTAGTLSTGSGNWFFVGRDTGTGTYIISGGTLNAQDIRIAASSWSWATTIGTVTLSGSATVNAAGAVLVNAASGSGEHNQGTLNVNGGTLNSEYDLILAVGGASDGFGTMNIAAGGTVNVATTTKRYLQMNEFDSVQAILNVNGGTLNLNANTDLRFSINGGTGTSAVNLNSGTITSYSGNQTGSGGGGVLDLNLAGGSVNNTFNLNGGTLTIGGIVSSTTTGTRVFNFNGGTLKPTANNSSFFASGVASAAKVLAGGAIIDTAGYNITIGQALLDIARDGGLTKNGNGILTLTGANTFNGPVAVNGGTVYANKGNAPNNQVFSYVSGITVNNGGTLRSAENSLFGYDSFNYGSQEKPITVNAGGTLTLDSGLSCHVGTVTLAGGTLANLGPSTAWGSWMFNDATDKLLVTDDSTITAVNVIFQSSSYIDVTAGKTLTVSGTLTDGSSQGVGKLTKTGNGIMTLSGANTYTGNTTISAGTLALGVGGSLASPNISVATGATFDVSALSSYALNGSGTLTNGINKSGSALTQGQVVIGSDNLTYGGALTVTAGGDALANGDSFTLVSKSSGTLSGWFTGVTLPSLSSGLLSWDTNHLATAGVLDVYSFTTTSLTVSMLSNTVATISAGKLANHASSFKGTPAAIAASSPAHGLANVSAGALTYTPTTDYMGSDSFTVTYQDGHGVQTMTVSVTVNQANVGPSLAAQNNGSGYGTFTASGMPNTTYVVQISTDLSTWNDYSTVTAAANGLISYTDIVTIAGHGGTVYYRLKQQ